MKKLILVLLLISVVSFCACATTPGPTTTPGPATPRGPAPAPTPAPTVVDEPKISEEEMCTMIWNKIPSQLPDGYSKTDLSRDTTVAEYKGDGKWQFSASGKVRKEGPLTTEIVKTDDYWVDRESCNVTSYELSLTAVYFEKTRTLDISVEKQNEQIITESSDTPILRQEFKLDYELARGTAHQGVLEGRIENIGKIPIIGLLAKYTLFDENGRTLTIEECEITPYTILPGEKGRYMHNFRITGGHLQSYVCWFITKNGHEFEYLEGSGEEEPVFFYEMDIEEAAADINLPPVPFESYVIPLHEDIRNTTLTLISDVPKDINSNAASWKIWKIHNWVANNIKYVSDPLGFEYMAYPYETLESKAGDCDDYAVLLASMYESSGLDAMIAFVDVTGDSKVEHVTCLVYYPQSATSFLEEEEIIINSQGMSYPLGKRDLEYILGTDTLIPNKTSDAYDDYQEGIWIVADPPFAIETSIVGYILHKPYVILAVSDVGS